MEAGRIGGSEEVKGRTPRRASRWSANSKVGGTRKIKPFLRRKGLRLPGASRWSAMKIFGHRAN